jgi:hypothetical protein
MAKIGLKVPQTKALGVTASKLICQNYLPLFEEEKRREQLLKAIDRINSLQGENSIYPAIIDQAKLQK